MDIKIVPCGDFSENIVNGIIALVKFMHSREDKTEK